MELLAKIEIEILNPVIKLLFGLAVAIFVYGVVQFIWKSDDEEARKAGAQHIMWGLVGLFIMTAAFAIQSFIIKTLH